MSEPTKKDRTQPAFPTVVVINGRNYIWRYDLEIYKGALVRHALGGQSAPPPLRPEHDVLIPFKIVAVELGVGRRTVGRRMKDTADAAAA